MKKFFTAVMFALVAFVSFVSIALPGAGTRYQLIIDGVSVSVLVDGHPALNAYNLSDGDTINAHYLGGCTPAGQGTWHVAFVETLTRNSNGVYVVTGTQQLEIGPGCENANWTFHAGANPPCTQTSEYCPCNPYGDE